MQTNWTANHIVLHGRLLCAPERSHCSHGEAYDRFPLSVCRLSGTQDRLNVLVPERMLAHCPLREGEEVSVEGEVRSFNNKSGVGARLVISVYARQLWAEQAEDENHLDLSGTLCKPPVYRCTPLGREVCDLMLAVNRRYGRTDYLPCIAWGGLARQCARRQVGDALELSGRLQSRVYVKRCGEQSQERTAFEISVMTLAPVVPAASEPVCTSSDLP